MTGRLPRIGFWFGAVALWSTSAHAAPGDATRLEYARSAAAKNCPDRDALRSAVTKRLGYDPFFPVARQTIVVEIADVSDGLRARMNLVDDQELIVGSRELRERAEHCDELVASLALAISIALDPSAALGVEPAEDVSAESRAAKPADATDNAPSAPSEGDSKPSPVSAPRSVSERRAPVPKRARTSTTPITARAAAFVATGVAPALAWGVRAGASMRWDWFQLSAEFADQFPAQRSVSSGSVQASLYEGSVAPCVAQSWLAACALLNLGVLHSEGRNIDYPAANNSLYAALGARLEAAPVLVGRLRLLLDADALKSLNPVTLRLHGEQAWKTPFVSFVIGLGLALQFP